MSRTQHHHPQAETGTLLGNQTDGDNVPFLARGRQARNVTLVQPLRLMLTLAGLSPDATVLNRLYQLFIMAWLVLNPILLFYMAVHVRTKFTESTYLGVALVALVPIISQIVMMVCGLCSLSAVCCSALGSRKRCFACSWRIRRLAVHGAPPARGRGRAAA